MEAGLSRRNFIKGGALGAAALSAFGLAGCSPSASESGKLPASDASLADSGDLFSGGVEQGSPSDPRYTADIVVVGAGAAGLSATVEAVNQGLKVVTIEASSAPGGTTQFAEGILGVSTPIQQKLGIANDISAMVQREMEFSNYCTDSMLIKDYLEHADEDIAWLQDMGVEFYEDVIGGTTQHLYVGQGKQMTQVLASYAEDKGADVVCGATAKRLYMQDGKVAGLVAQDEKGEFSIEAPVVVLACGGYIQNDDMVDELQRFSHTRVKYTANPGHTGEHLAMAYSAGADRTGITLMHFIWACTRGLDLHSQLSTAFCNEGYFWINNHGERFCDESLVSLPSCVDNIILNQAKAYAILTDAEIDRLSMEGCAVGGGSYIFAGSKMDTLKDEVEQAKNDMPEGFYCGDTVAELSEALGVDESKLAQTIKDYNAMVAAGSDDDFGKKAPFLHEISEEGPFYAVELLCSAFCTMGGIRVNRENEVLDENFEGIPGLYCAGVDCSGLQGSTYCILLAGGAQGHAVYSGRNSARKAKAYLSK